MNQDFQQFHYETLDEMTQELVRLNISIPVSRDLSVLSRPVSIGKWKSPNALACHPMEGSDANLDGTPGPLTIRRYERFSAGGSGLIWFEAVAVAEEGKASSRQLAIREDNVKAFKEIVDHIRDISLKTNGSEHIPLILMQLTHSGRFSKPHDTNEPIIPCHNPVLDERSKVNSDTPIITDDELEVLEGKFVQAALLAQRAGFDGVDIKACHRYLASELLSAFTREGKYGGSFEGRTRFILNITDRIREACGPDFLLGARINLYDGIPYPYGWGVDKDDVNKPDYTEPLALASLLFQKGVRILNATMGTPYFNPHVNRPYDKGGYIPDEHPLSGVARLLEGAGIIQHALPELAVVGTGYTWLREFAPYFASGAVLSGGAKLIGFGREAFAYPDYAKDILNGGAMMKTKCCITCGKCAEILRAGGTSGCVIKDASVYAPLYKKFCNNS